MVVHNPNDDIQDEDSDQPGEASYRPTELDDLVDHDHAVLMDNQMDAEMAVDGFSIESGLITDLDSEPTTDHGEPFTEDFTDIFDNLGRESDDEVDTERDDNS